MQHNILCFSAEFLPVSSEQGQHGRYRGACTKRVETFQLEGFRAYLRNREVVISHIHYQRLLKNTEEKARKSGVARVKPPFERFLSHVNRLLLKPLFAWSQTFIDKSKARSGRCQKSP
jgi:hypothetical protein